MNHTFRGTNVIVYGYTALNHGLMKIVIDGELSIVANTTSSDDQHHVDVLLFMSEDLKNGIHIIHIECESQANGINGILYLDNNGEGFISFNNSEYHVDKGEDLSISIARIGT